MKVTDTILTTRQRATTADALNGLKRLVTVTNDDDAFAEALWQACEQGGVDFAFAYAHTANETDYFRDVDFTRDKNPAGIGHPDNAPGGVVFASFRAGARFYVGELLLKLRQPIPPALADTRSYSPAKWDSVARIVGGALGPFPAVERIADLNKRFGPNNREAVWMTDANGPQAIVDKGNRIFANLPDQEDPTTVPTHQRPVIVVDAGHRDTSRTGNPAETDLTDDMARAYVEEFRRRGYTAYWYQRDLDRDADPDDTVGGLDTVARGIGAWLRTQPWALFLSVHYDGAHSVLHAIVPDNIGLSTAYPEGRDPADTAANNTLDVELGTAIMARMQAAGFGNLFRGLIGIPGLMSERETGVGRQGFRLAVFSATAPARMTAVRLVIEHAGTSDPHARNFAGWARAAADAIDSVYGQVVEEPPTLPPPDPEPEPSPWPAKRIPAPDSYFAQDIEIDLLEEQRFKTTRLRCVQGGRFRTGPSREAPIGVASPYRAGRTYRFVGVVPVGGEVWLVSSAGSWAPLKNFEEV